MMKSSIQVGLVCLLATLALVAPTSAQPDTRSSDTPDHPTAYTALRAVAKSLGHDALDRVTEVSGRDGAPQPSLWKVVLKEGDGSREVDVTDGKVTDQRALTRPPASTAAIRLSDLNLDSSGAFDATDARARKVKLRFDSLNYTLRVSESTGKPVWRLELIDKEGTGVGTIRLAAHDGTVLSTDGRLASNPPPASTPRAAASTPAPVRVIAATPRPSSTPRRTVTNTTTTTTTYERLPAARPAATVPPATVDNDNVYAPTVEEGGLFTRTGRTLDKTSRTVESTLRRTGSKIQRFFTRRGDEPETRSQTTTTTTSNMPD